MKSERSIRSIKSTRSLRLSKAHSEVPRNEIIDFENVLPIACAKFNCSNAILVKRTQRNDDYYRSLKHTDTTRKRLSMPQSMKQESNTAEVQVENAGSTSETEISSTQINTLIVNSVYDTYNSLTEIRLEKLAQVPRTLMQVIGFLVPYYKNISTMTIVNCKIDACIIYELSKIIRVSTINQVCLDGTSVAEANYTILLDTLNLRYLSLSRCNINDQVCELLASKLHLSATGEKLLVLNLSSNHITDVGAKSLAYALRTNRYLRYLNIADNHVTDEGSLSILRVLTEFPLTCDEILNKRQRYFTYLRKRHELYLKYLDDQNSEELSHKPAKRKRNSATSLKSKSGVRKEKDVQNLMSYDDSIRADILAKQILGIFVDPFQTDCIKNRDDHIYCLGNMALSYLNMSYNNLSFISVKALRNVISYQMCIKKTMQSGLMKVVIDGNNLPIKCPEMTYINEVLGGKNNDTKRSKAHSKIGL